MDDRLPIVEDDEKEFHIKPDQRIDNFFGDKDAFTPSKFHHYLTIVDIFGVSELDLFGMETRAR